MNIFDYFLIFAFDIFYFFLQILELKMKSFYLLSASDIASLSSRLCYSRIRRRVQLSTYSSPFLSHLMYFQIYRSIKSFFHRETKEKCSPKNLFLGLLQKKCSLPFEILVFDLGISSKTFALKLASLLLIQIFPIWAVLLIHFFEIVHF